MFHIGSLFRNKGKGRINITSVKINYMGAVHELEGLSTNDKEFDIRIPFKNRISSEMGDNVKKPDLRIDSISVNEPFELLHVSPELPISLPYGDSIMLVIKIKAPSLSYSGPLFLNMQVRSPELVHIGISTLRISMDGRNKELPIKRDIYIVKSDVFKQEVDLAGVVNSGESVNAIKASPPFEVSNTLPPLPFTLQEGQKISIFIKAPNYNYAGPLELEIS